MGEDVVNTIDFPYLAIVPSGEKWRDLSEFSPDDVVIRYEVAKLFPGGWRVIKRAPLCECRGQGICQRHA